MSSKPDKERYNNPATGATKDVPGQSRKPGQQQGQPQQKENQYDQKGGRGTEQNKPQR